MYSLNDLWVIAESPDNKEPKTMGKVATSLGIHEISREIFKCGIIPHLKLVKTIYKKNYSVFPGMKPFIFCCGILGESPVPFTGNHPVCSGIFIVYDASALGT